MAHAAKSMAWLVRILMGRDAVADEKTAAGPSLCILGVDVMISSRGFKCKPSAKKIPGWLSLIEDSLRCGVLLPGVASKLAGKLSWAQCQMFNQVGRAMLRPIFDQATKRNGQVDANLRRALEWWRAVLRKDIAELRLWDEPVTDAVHLFCDASGMPAHLGAVLIVDKVFLWTHADPPSSLIEKFKRRADNQIMGLELLAITLGLCSFREQLSGRQVVIHCDNTGAEVAISKGSARALDHAQLVHQQWLFAVSERLRIHAKRVSTSDNIADLPSRRDTKLLEFIRAREVKPVFEEEFLDGAAWEVLNERWAM